MDKREILKKQLEIITPSEKELKELNFLINNTVILLKQAIKSRKIKAEPFIAGSFVKGTIIKKDKYDADIFVRFDKKYDEKSISSILSRIVPKNAVRLHGSRDYFVLKSKDLNKEIIPIMKIKTPEEELNSKNLSYFHVKYVLDKIKKGRKLAEEIRLAKAFIHYSGCYGAESYIHGFSGYAVELLLIHYKTFMNFARAMANVDLSKKLVIDIEKDYKKDEVFREMNESKLQSPIILVDPTYKKRNALAALSLETLEKLKKASKDFLIKPSEKFFQAESRERKFGKYKNTVKITTKRQAGDIAGTKLKKFYNFFIKEAEKYLDISSGFEYNESRNEGIIYINAVPRKMIEFRGPPITMKEALKAFKRQHKKVVVKKEQAYAYEKNNITLKDFIEELKNKDIEEMDISAIELSVSG